MEKIIRDGSQKKQYMTLALQAGGFLMEAPRAYGNYPDCLRPVADTIMSSYGSLQNAAVQKPFNLLPVLMVGHNCQMLPTQFIGLLIMLKKTIRILLLFISNIRMSILLLIR
jgi:hypothetical protein